MLISKEQLFPRHIQQHEYSGFTRFWDTDNLAFKSLFVYFGRESRVCCYPFEPTRTVGMADIARVDSEHAVNHCRFFLISTKEWGCVYGKLTWILRTWKVLATGENKLPQLWKTNIDHKILPHTFLSGFILWEFLYCYKKKKVTLKSLMHFSSVCKEPAQSVRLSTKY